MSQRTHHRQHGAALLAAMLT
ncbi:MAG: hypothetical protein QG643_299, partial [Pseudomonadota bacterium]|nr:hypothetical protein [Pseudomonadota bacterium]